jgi:phage repressor protein C with HTH and peptisase S24 domain
MEAWERVGFIMNKEGLNKNSFSKAINLSNNVTITRILNEKRKPSNSTIDKILKAFPKYSRKWLTEGIGDPLIPDAEYIAYKIECSPALDTNVMMVPLVNQYAHAGYMSGYADEEYVETLPKIPWIVDKEYKGRYISFEVKGDSMDDGLKHSYEQGDILLCREINPDYWKCKLHIHQWDAFVIVHKTEGIVVKQIIDHDVEKGIITVHSFNPIYEDYKIDLREVAQIFNVVKQQKNK